jgi:hypothetical protein
MCKAILAVLSIAVFAASASLPTTARAIKIRVLIKGVVVLEGGTSDAGKQDADDVWRMFVAHTEARPFVRLRQTKDFNPEFVQIDRNGNTVLKASDKSKVTISVSYGGQADVRELRLSEKLIPAAEGKPEQRLWSLDAKQLKQLFDRRLVPRRDVSRLKHPDRLKF